MLKPGGQATIMRYHHPSLSGAVLWLWLRFGIFSGKSLRRVVYDHFESPGTKTYTEGEVRSMMMATGFEDLVMLQVFSPGDLLLNRPLRPASSSLYRLAWRLYPRALVKKMGRRWGLFLLISARKPGNIEGPRTIG